MLPDGFIKFHPLLSLIQIWGVALSRPSHSWLYRPPALPKPLSCHAPESPEGNEGVLMACLEQLRIGSIKQRCGLQKGALCSNEGSNFIHAIERCSLQGTFTTVLPFSHNYSCRRKHVFRITFLQWESVVSLQVVQLSPCLLVSWESAGWGSWSCPAAQAGEQPQPCFQVLSLWLGSIGAQPPSNLQWNISV